MALPTVEDLRRDLERLDGKGYGAYKQLQGGAWLLGGARPSPTVRVERVQADPFAPPSRLTVTVPAPASGVPAGLAATPDRRRALGDHLARLLAARLPAGVRIDAGRQEVLDRTACRAEADGGVVARVAVELPARGRRVLGRRAAELLTGPCPQRSSTPCAGRRSTTPRRVSSSPPSRTLSRCAPSSRSLASSRSWWTGPCCRAAAASTTAPSWGPPSCRSPRPRRCG